MKITIRKNTFETNSSSLHSLVITNEKDMEKDKEEFLKNDAGLIIPGYSEFCKPLKTKEEKCYFLNDLFNKENVDYDMLKYQHKVFMKVLKDNKEEEILMNIALYNKEFKKAKYSEPPFCQHSFYNGVLIECNCPFYDAFNKYFKHSLDIDKETNDFPKIDKNNALYQELYKFIYEDGVIVPYEYL